VAGAVQRPSWLPFAWQAQYTEPPEELRRAWAPLARGFVAAFRVAGAVHRASCVGAAGPRLAFAWQAQYRELPGCLSPGRRSTQSLLEELRRAWAPLARGWLSRGCRVAGAVHRASLSSFGFGTSWYFAGVAAISGFGLRYHDAVCKVWSSASLCRMLAVSVGSHCHFSTRS